MRRFLNTPLVSADANSKSRLHRRGWWTSMLAAILVSFFVSAAFAAPGVDAQTYLDDIKYLASPQLKGRATPSPELEKAASYIAKQPAIAKCAAINAGRGIASEVRRQKAPAQRTGNSPSAVIGRIGV